jgi:hypothetical protein
VRNPVAKASVRGLRSDGEILDGMIEATIVTPTAKRL